MLTGKIDVEIVAFALIRRVFLQMDDQIEIAVRAAVDSGAALARETDALALTDSFGNRDLEALVEQHAAGAMALRAEATAFRAGAVTSWTEIFDLQRDCFRAAGIDVAQSELDGRFEVLSAARASGGFAWSGSGAVQHPRRTCRRSRRTRSLLRRRPGRIQTLVRRRSSGTAAAVRLAARLAASSGRERRTSYASPDRLKLRRPRKSL